MNFHWGFEVGKVTDRQRDKKDEKRKQFAKTARVQGIVPVR
jgi:hypothetical protein